MILVHEHPLVEGARIAVYYANRGGRGALEEMHLELLRPGDQPKCIARTCSFADFMEWRDWVRGGARDYIRDASLGDQSVLALVIELVSPDSVREDGGEPCCYLSA